MSGAPRTATLALAAILITSCAHRPAPTAQDRFFAALTAHCGKAYAGGLVSDQDADADMRGKAMVMHVRECSADRIAIPFHIDGIGPDGGWDRSRTWVVTRTAAGLRLKHDHRHADGTADALTLYGGDTVAPGTDQVQHFPADAESIAMFTNSGRAVSNSNVWRVTISPDRFEYALQRPGRDFRVAFDLTQPVASPPAPWGW